MIKRKVMNVLLMSSSRRFYPTYVTFLESLGQQEIKYSQQSEFDLNQEDQECQECPPGVFFKETGVLMDFFHIHPHICYIFRILAKKEINY
jgi:hypothetical protein